MIRVLLLSGLAFLVTGLCLIFMGILLKILPLILVSIVVLFIALLLLIFGVLITPAEVGYQIGNLPIPGYLTPGARGREAVVGRPIVQNANVQRGTRGLAPR
ncbi:BVCV-like protein [Camellia virus A]|uniref:BVCV-like protein n=1 Tax=Camellia virus A TaxID=2899887 RepID=A0AAX2ZMX5_9SECO|nr:BVCV-like protein [Camellia virus A]UFX17411.1 BVCV-like protein [Camellia virus A]